MAPTSSRRSSSRRHSNSWGRIMYLGASVGVAALAIFAQHRHPPSNPLDPHHQHHQHQLSERMDHHLPEDIMWKEWWSRRHWIGNLFGSNKDNSNNNNNQHKNNVKSTSSKFQFSLFQNQQNQQQHKEDQNNLKSNNSKWNFNLNIHFNFNLNEFIDAITKSTPRFLALCNLILSISFVSHGLFVDSFLLNQHNTFVLQNNSVFVETLASYFFFKLLLVSAIVEPDALDAFILLLWYSVHSFMKSLAILTQECVMGSVHRGVAVPHRVVYLWCLLMIWNGSSAVVCYTLFHTAGVHLVLVLLADCVLLLLELFATASCYCDHWSSTHDHDLSNNSDSVTDDSDNGNHENTHSQNRWRRFMFSSSSDQEPQQILTLIRILKPLLALCHYVHLWFLHFHFGVVGCIVIGKCHAYARNIFHEIQNYRRQAVLQSELDVLFPDYHSPYNHDRSSSSVSKEEDDELCCICLNPLCCTPLLESKTTVSNVKKLQCGHLYHSHCLRQVVERARSIESAKCPMCRSFIIQQDQLSQEQSVNNVNDLNVNNNNIEGNNNGTNNSPGDQPVFRFTTEGIIPAWIPIPSFSFEVVRRNNPSIPLPQALRAGDIVRNEFEVVLRNDSFTNMTQELRDHEHDPQQQEQQQNNRPLETQIRHPSDSTLNDSHNHPSPRFEQERNDDAMHNYQDENDNGHELHQAGQGNEIGVEHVQERQGQRQAGGVWSRLFRLFTQTMTVEEERIALNQLSDMFPQYSRNILQQELQRLGSAEFVVESIFLGRFERQAQNNDNSNHSYEEEDDRNNDSNQNNNAILENPGNDESNQAGHLHMFA